jgi:hypothetical protein
MKAHRPLLPWTVFSMSFLLDAILFLAQFCPSPSPAITPYCKRREKTAESGTEAKVFHHGLLFPSLVLFVREMIIIHILIDVRT